MLKKILGLILILYTSYTLPSYSAPTSRQNIAISCAAIVAGIICTWIAYKNFKKGWHASKEFDRHLKTLNEMGIKVHKVSKSEYRFNPFAIKMKITEHYTMNIPLGLSYVQDEKAKEH